MQRLKQTVRKITLIKLKQFCAANLPRYMIPDQFAALESLPKTSTDKIDYGILQTMVESTASLPRKLAQQAR